MGLLVDQSDEDAMTDAVVVLDQAAQRARVEHRPLVVVLARQSSPWSTNAVLHVLVAERIDAQLDALRRTVTQVCDLAGWSARVLVVAEPFACTRRGRQRRWQRQLATLAELLGAELHPPPEHQAAGHPLTPGPAAE